MVFKEGSSLCGILEDKEAECVPDTERRLCSWTERKEQCTMCLETEQLQVQMGSSVQVQDFCLTFTSIVRDFERRLRLGFIGKYADCVKGGRCKNGQDEDIRLLSRAA